ncbi:MAG: lipid II:glycine glycyltransferase FemX [Pseudomonadota bacterium]|uniref:lipid II:glycine glycyltransferase FemX n=1 Tax=Roseovarius TaxID=74030 RepID=UPI0022A6D273|nr:GNAT family N-acetyltransferase [Roseovarius sp. EGI FJ00037]MCZ0810994.1 GNAT family N-acetyltransferase [Roseovarius sp. EGI FJ00037]
MDFTLGSQPQPPGPCALQQHPFYGRALAGHAAQIVAFHASDEGRVQASAQILQRRFGPFRVCYLPRGPVWAPETGDRSRALVLHALLRALPPALWIATPETMRDKDPYRSAGFRAVMTPQHMAELDLTYPQAQRLSHQHGKWRNRLRRAQAGGLDILSRQLDPIRDMALLQREAAQRRARGYAALPPEFALSWAACSQDATRLFIARRDGQTVAFMLFLLHPPVATYHIGWTGSAGRALSAHHLLLWEAANWLAARGHTRLDLGLVDTSAAPGLARFKLGSGANPRPLGPAMLRFAGPMRRIPRRSWAAGDLPLAFRSLCL